MAESKIPMTTKVKRARIIDGGAAVHSDNPDTFTFTLPSDFASSLGVHITRAWPQTSWTNAWVVMKNDATINGRSGEVSLLSGNTQYYDLKLDLIYIAN